MVVVEPAAQPPCALLDDLRRGLHGDRAQGAPLGGPGHPPAGGLGGGGQGHQVTEVLQEMVLSDWEKLS